MKKQGLRWLAMAVLMGVAGDVFATSEWDTWVQGVKQDAVSHGVVNASQFDDIFSHFSGPNARVLQLDQTQPEHRISFSQYRKTRADTGRIAVGHQEWLVHGTLLTQIGGQYGVDPCVMAALWGMETSYGRFMGGFSTVEALATLAYQSPRASFFRGELMDALGILAGGNITYSKFVGEWAGGTGQPQFLPSSWMQYAVDYNGDGKRDIWTSLPDVFASIANYLSQVGWKPGVPVVLEVQIPTGTVVGEAHTVAEWRNRGVEPIAGASWPADTLTATLIQPSAGGPTLLAFANFNTLMRWNHSTYYGATVSYLADQICRR